MGLNCTRSASPPLPMKHHLSTVRSQSSDLFTEEQVGEAPSSDFPFTTAESTLLADLISSPSLSTLSAPRLQNTPPKSVPKMMLTRRISQGSLGSDRSSMSLSSEASDFASTFHSSLNRISDSGVWIGNLACLVSKEWSKEGIGAILSAMPQIPEEVREVLTNNPHVAHFLYPLDDDFRPPEGDEVHPTNTLFASHPHLCIHDAMAFIHEHISNGRPVMIHCEQGKRRSAAVVAAYLIWYEHMDCKQALQFVQTKRRGASVPGLWRQELDLLVNMRQISFSSEIASRDSL
eukprot:NODE_3227_length_1007_cov_21.731818_g3081_i0.p1 GENE.NODE_3227_length_1007_cov_21.731818_g3081_i0~~NODE_3227_length_1007_cov_21.731818_g3081_i0.p1  ORF type:complete len:309 (+),score=59.51 NODE_3227_length_1007_cov_21.731818_g3081_i0:59-928(+)